MAAIQEMPVLVIRAISLRVKAVPTPLRVKAAAPVSRRERAAIPVPALVKAGIPAPVLKSRVFRDQVQERVAIQEMPVLVIRAISLRVRAAPTLLRVKAAAPVSRRVKAAIPVPALVKAGIPAPVLKSRVFRDQVQERAAIQEMPVLVIRAISLRVKAAPTPLRVKAANPGTLRAQAEIPASLPVKEATHHLPPINPGFPSRVFESRNKEEITINRKVDEADLIHKTIVHTIF
jgi:hypothetical protein